MSIIHISLGLAAIIVIMLLMAWFLVELFLYLDDKDDTDYEK